MVDNFNVSDKESIQALHNNQRANQRSFGVDNGCVTFLDAISDYRKLR